MGGQRYDAQCETSWQFFPVWKPPLPCETYPSGCISSVMLVIAYFRSRKVLLNLSGSHQPAGIKLWFQPCIFCVLQAYRSVCYYPDLNASQGIFAKLLSFLDISRRFPRHFPAISVFTIGRTCHTVSVVCIANIATPKKQLTKIFFCNLFNGRKQLNLLASPGLKYVLSFKHIVEYFPKSGSRFPTLCFFNLDIIYNTLNSFLFWHIMLIYELAFILSC